MKKEFGKTQYKIMKLLKYLVANYGSKELGQEGSRLCRVYILGSLMLDSHMTFDALLALYQALDRSDEADMHLRHRICVMSKGAMDADRRYKPLVSIAEKEYLGRYSTYSITIEGFGYLCDMTKDISSWANGKARKNLATGKEDSLSIPTKWEYKKLYEEIKDETEVDRHRILTSQCMAQIQGYGKEPFLISKTKSFSDTGEMLEGLEAFGNNVLVSPNLMFEYVVDEETYPVMIEADTGSEEVSTEANQEADETVLYRKTINHLKLSEMRERRRLEYMPETLVYILGMRDTNGMTKGDEVMETVKDFVRNKNLISLVTMLLTDALIEHRNLRKRAKNIDTQDILAYIDEEYDLEDPAYESLKVYREQLVKLTNMYAQWCKKTKRRSLRCSDVDGILKMAVYEHDMGRDRGSIEINRSDAKSRLGQLAKVITLLGADGRDVAADFFAGVTVSVIPACDVRLGMSTLMPFHYGDEYLRIAARCYGLRKNFQFAPLMPYFHFSLDRCSYAMKNCCYDKSGKRIYIEDLGLDIGAFYRLGRYLSCTSGVLRDCMALFIVNDDLTSADGRRVDSAEFWSGIEGFAPGFINMFLYAYGDYGKLPILKETHDFAFIRRSDYICSGTRGMVEKAFISFPDITIGRCIGRTYDGEIMRYHMHRFKWFSQHMIDPIRLCMTRKISPAWVDTREQGEN